MKLVYWFAKCEDDADCYSIREKTKAAAEAKKKELGEDRFGKVKKVTVEYESGFDLMKTCMSEGRLWQEAEGDD